MIKGGALSSAQILPTPLTRLRWWRVCLDEAQMVENTMAKAAAMAVEIQAQHRFAALYMRSLLCTLSSFTPGCGTCGWQWTR